MPEAHRVNDFLFKGKGDLAQFLDGPLSMWRTEEILNMLLWMREFNASGRGRIEFTGFDMQNPTRALANIREFVAAEDPEYAATFDRASRMALSIDPRSADPEAGREWDAVIAHLEASRPHPGVEWIIQNARIVRQFVNWATSLMNGPASMTIRDASMAANVKWILDQKKGVKAVLSSHNFHAMTGPLYLNQASVDDSMGAVLRRIYGKDLVTFGFVFNQGSFRARAKDGSFQSFTVGPLPIGSLDATLAESGLAMFVLDLRLAPNGGPIADWFGAKRQTRNIMAGFSEDARNYTIFDQSIRELYDCLVFVDRTTAARPLKASSGR